MDSVTQFVLGASVGEAVAGKKAGNWAMLWGGICGTIPDLDVFMRYFFNEVEMLGIHRGFSHSILFAILIAPILGFIQFKIHKKQEATFKNWTLLSFLSVVTHPLLDSFTTYGTQLFQPFSNYPVAFNSIFIIDLIYTLPFIIALIIILFQKRNSRQRRIINYSAIIFTTFYLFLGLISKYSADIVFEDSFKETSQIIQDFSAPSPLNIILWNTLIVCENDKVYFADYSHLDKTKNINYQSLERNTYLIKHNLNDYPIQKLLWFSRGLYKFEKKGNDIYFSDLRFNVSNEQLSKENSSVFKFKLIFKNNEVIGFERANSGLNIDFKSTFEKLIIRILGK